MNPIIPDKYELIGEPLGTGGFGSVYKALVKTKDGYRGPVALKIVNVVEVATFHDLSEYSVIQTLDKEVRILRDLSSDCKNNFVLCYYDSYYDESTGMYYIETELIEGMDFFDFVNIQNISTAMKYYYLLLIARDVAIGLKYIHDTGYIHNDIKLDNIMIDINKNEPRILYTPVIIDLGLACEIREGLCYATAGTPEYASPESVVPLENGATVRYPASDMWALGVTLYAAGKKVYPFRTIDSLFNEQQAYPRFYSSNILLNTIVNGLLRKDINTRFTAEQVIQLTNNIENMRPE